MLSFDTNGNLLVSGPHTISQAGYFFVAGAARGSQGATAPQRLMSLSTSNRVDTSLISPLFADAFNYAAQDTGRWSVALTTFTTSFAAGSLVLNAGSVTTASALAIVKTYWTTPMPTEGAIHIHFSALMTLAPVANTQIELGTFPLVSALTTPPDGAYFRYTTSGTLIGVINYNGTELTTANLTIPSALVNHDYSIIIDYNHVEFWIDGVFQASILSPTAQGFPIMSPYIQPTIRMFNAASAPTQAQQLKVTGVDVWQTDGDINRMSHFKQAEQGLMGYQGVTGMTMGSTATYANSAAATAGVPSNAAAVIAGLGGQVSETCTIAVNTDGMLCSFQVPTPTVNIPGRKLVITGVRISSCVTTALVGGPFINQYCLNFGQTSTSLATGETNVAKAPRRIPLGIQTWAATAAVGTMGQGIQMSFVNPIVVNPGEWVSVSTKNAGTVGTSGNITHMITFDAHWD